MIMTQKPWYAVERFQGTITVKERHCWWPQPPAGYAQVRINAAGICGADIRVCTGNKAVAAHSSHPVTLGHEGVGLVTAVGAGVFDLQVGDHVVVLPHALHAHHATYCPATQVEPACVGAGHTWHRGWDLPGVFTDVLIAPCTQLIRIEPGYLHLAERAAPDLGRGLFAFTEPLLCVLSAYQLMEQQVRLLLQRNVTAGRALVIGCGPIGVLHALALQARGFAVWLSDTLPSRARLALSCLEEAKGYLYDQMAPDSYDVVIVAASSVSAIRLGEAVTRNRGVLYLFAGLNAAEREELDRSGVLSYQRIHQAAHGFLTAWGSKTLLYLGHSGYYEFLSLEALAFVVGHAESLSKLVTGVIKGWSSPEIEARGSNAENWSTPDGEPAILSVLQQKVDLRTSHGKVLILC